MNTASRIRTTAAIPLTDGGAVVANAVLRAHRRDGRDYLCVLPGGREAWLPASLCEELAPVHSCDCDDGLVEVSEDHFSAARGHYTRERLVPCERCERGAERERLGGAL